METDKPPRSTSNTELFICFTSRHSSSNTSSSSSSMKISSKSILSPGRNRDPPISLSTSLSRRLRTNGSIKGGQASPAMFPTTAGKKRGCGFENQEPSSPKVTCIGQVRVKSKKKQGKRLRTLSRRHSGGVNTGEVSFRKLEQQQNLNPNVVSGTANYQDCLSGQRNQNQRWVHLPLTICEALRTFGSEFSCLFPCRSSCFSTSDKRDKEDKSPSAARNADTGHSSCGAALARWLVALQDGDGGGRDDGGGGGGAGREIELVVGGEDEDDNEDEGDIMPVRNSRRHVFEDLEIINDRIQLKEEEGRVSICIPPKNALLLMRCRSDPMKMEALANRFCEPSVPLNVVEEDEDDVQEQQQQEKHTDLEILDPKDEEFRDFVEVNQEQHNVVAEEEDREEENQEQSFSEEIIHTEDEEENLFLGFLFEEVEDQETKQIEAFSVQPAMEDGPEQEEMAEENALGNETEEPIEERSKQEESERETVRQVMEKKEDEDEEEEERENRVGVLPDCLLLMMCEPKLSMEVSKETWVCSTDFIRRPSDKKKHPVKLINGGDAAGQATATKEVIVGRNEPNSSPCPPQHTANRPPLHQQPRRSSCSLPPRSSCSLPAAASSMATVLEQKLANAVGYEPFVLTRCKSEPMRTAAKLVPETCFWKNRKLEPLRRASMGVGAAGVGF